MKEQRLHKIADFFVCYSHADLSAHLNMRYNVISLFIINNLSLYFLKETSFLYYANNVRVHHCEKNFRSVKFNDMKSKKMF